MAATLVSSLRTPNTTWEPVETFKTSTNNKPNTQIRIAKLVAEILDILSKNSINERENINKLKEKITKLAEDQAAAKNALGRIAVGSGVVSLASAFIPLAAESKMTSKFFQELVGAINNTVAKLLSTPHEISDFSQGSHRELFLREYDNLNNKMQSESSTSREFKEIVKEAQQIALLFP